MENGDQSLKQMEAKVRNRGLRTKLQKTLGSEGSSGQKQVTAHRQKRSDFLGPVGNNFVHFCPQ